MDASTPPETALKRVLAEQGPTQRWLAARTGIHESTISRIVNDRENPGAADAKAIAKALGRTVTECGWPHHEDGQVAA
jgi:transcriptional regulator with XRE-family HTH domain